jgi:arylsulfatase
MNIKVKSLFAVLSLALAAGLAPQCLAQTSGRALDRTHLPMPNTARPRTVVYDAKNPDSKNPPIEQLRPPKGAPNVLVILLDDAGFGSTSTFGGPCQTPTLEKLAAAFAAFTATFA